MSGSGDDSGLVRLWSVTLPTRIEAVAPPLADAFADGLWTAAWRRVHDLAPLAALLTGAMFRIVWPWINNIYSESLLFLMIVVAGAILSGPVGTMLLFGYAAGDVLMLPFNRQGLYGPMAQLKSFGGHFVGYMLLAIPAILIPQLGRRMTDEITAMIPSRKEPPLILRALLYAVSAAVLVFLWCQAMIVLVRPAFTWANQAPTTEAVQQVQTRWQWIVGVAVVAALARVVLEAIARSSHAAPLIQRLEAERWSDATRRGVVWRRAPAVVRVTLAAIVVTLVLAGTYVTTADAIVVLAAVAALKAWRGGLLGSLPVWWSGTMRKVPALARLIIAPALGFVLAGIIIRLFWSTGSMRPVMIGALLTLVIFHLLFPLPPKRSAA